MYSEGCAVSEPDKRRIDTILSKRKSIIMVSHNMEEAGKMNAIVLDDVI